MNTTSKCDCGASWNWQTGVLSDNCDEPCRFAMGKSGEGDPPIPDKEFIEGYRAGYHAGYERRGIHGR